MPNFFYVDANNQKQGPVNDQQLQELVLQKIILPTTPLETESGHKGVAGQIPGLFADVESPFVQTADSNAFCGNCGTAFNPEQIICLKCGAAVGTRQGKLSADGEVSDVCFMWMHLTWILCPLVTLIIWSVASKSPKAKHHRINIINAFCSFFVYFIILAAAWGCFFAYIATQNEYQNNRLGPIYDVLDNPMGSSSRMPPPPPSSLLDISSITPPALSATVSSYQFPICFHQPDPYKLPVNYLVVIVVLATLTIWLFIWPFISSILVAIAAAKGNVSRYLWAIQFFKIQS